MAVYDASAQQSRCSSAAHRQFDFWVGDWNVTDVRGATSGTSSIERVLGGCVLSESWRGSNGVLGRSLSAFSSADDKWHQAWVDNEGTVLMLSGGLVNGEMVLEGERRLPDGSRRLDRITWTPNVDGTLRQVWQASGDSGMRWTTVFDGIYRRIGATEPTGAGSAPLAHPY